MFVYVCVSICCLHSWMHKNKLQCWARSYHCKLSQWKCRFSRESRCVDTVWQLQSPIQAKSELHVDYLYANLQNFHVHHSVCGKEEYEGINLYCATFQSLPLEAGADKYPWWLESFVLGRNADCNLSHWRQKPDVGGCLCLTGKGA